MTNTLMRERLLFVALSASDQRLNPEVRAAVADAIASLLDLGYVVPTGKAMGAARKSATPRETLAWEADEAAAVKDVAGEPVTSQRFYEPG